MEAVKGCKRERATWDAPERVARKVVLGAQGWPSFSYSTSQCQQESMISSNRHSEYRNAQKTVALGYLFRPAFPAKKF